jgi:hypothetical protein
MSAALGVSQVTHLIVREDDLGSKSSGQGDGTIPAAWITGICAVVAAVIGAVALIVTTTGSSTSHASGQGAPSTTQSAPAGSPSTGTAEPAFGQTWTEKAYTSAQTFSNFVSAGGPFGVSLTSGQSVQVSCRVKGFKVQDGDVWWYRLSASPWDGKYYVSTDNFWNTSDTSGNPINGIYFDPKVKVCT